MGNPNSAFIAIAALSGVLNLLLGLYAGFKKSDFSGIKYYALIAFASSIYAWGFSFELASGSLDEIKRWVVVEYIGMPFVPPLSLVLAMHYAGLERYLRGVRLPALFVIPAVTLLLVATNDSHHLFYHSIYLREGAPAPMADVTIGEWYIVHGSYTFGCLFAAIVLLARHWTKTKGTFRRQLATLIAGMLVPVVAAFLYLTGATPNGMDPVPVLSCVTTALAAWAIFTNRMLTVVPVARDTIFESMRDGVLVLDSSGRLVDYNQAAAATLPALGPRSIGRAIDELWRSECGSGFPLSLAGDTLDGGEEQAEWPGLDGDSYYRIRSSSVRKPGQKSAGRIVMLIDVTEQRRLQQHLQRLAYYDGLTGIYNRARFLHLSRQSLADARSAGTPLSLILFDVDHFKRINDSYGHETGDEALRHVVGVCGRALGPDALFGRYGGEEFVLCLPDCGIEEAAAIAERLRSDIAASPLRMPDGDGEGDGDGERQDIRITASFGVAEASGSADQIQELLREADKALYRSKESGRNAVRRAEPAASVPS